MKASVKQALSIGLMATMLLPGFLSAQAGNEKPTTDAATQDKTTTTPSQSGAAKAFPVKPKAPAPKSEAELKEAGPFAEINARMVNVERRLVEDQSTGRLSTAQVQELHKAFDQIAETLVQYRAAAGKFNYWQKVRLQILLDKLATSIAQQENDRDLASPDLQFTRNDIAERIELSGKQHRLSPQEVADLKQRLKFIDSLSTMLVKEKGRLTYSDKLMLCVDYDHLALCLILLERERPLAKPDLAAGGAEIEKRIAEGVKTNKITEAQAQEFKKQLGELRATAEKAPAGLEPIIAIGLEMEALSNKIESLLEPAAVFDPDAALKHIDSRIAAALDDGRLNALETLELKEDLDEIRTARAQMSSGGLKDEDRQALKLDITRLEERINRQLHVANRLWPGLTVAIVHLSHRNKQALEAKRLSEEEAKASGDEIIQLNKKRVEFNKVGMTSEQALSLAEDLQKIAGRLEKAMKDREMEIPKVEGIKSALDTRIGDYCISGQLNAGDVRSLMNSLAELNSVREKYAAANTPPARAAFALAFELERLSSNLEEEMHGHEALFPGVETRRSQIEALINEGISSGRLDSASENFYKQKLAENSKLEKQYRAEGSGLTGERALELVSGLENLWEKLDRQLRENHVTTADLVSLEGAVEKKMRQGFSYGLLSPAEADALRQNYDGVVASFEKMRAEEGGLSYGERLAFAYGFQRLSAFTERNLRTTPIVLPNLEAQRAALEQRLANLLVAGRLSLPDAQQAKALLDEVARSAAEKQASGHGLSYQEGLILALDMDRLNHRIWESSSVRKTPLADIDELQRSADKKIEEAKSKGALSAAQYKSFKDALERIAANEAAFRISDESINYAEATNLIQQINRLESEIAAGTKGSAARPATAGKSKTGKK